MSSQIRLKRRYSRRPLGGEQSRSLSDNSPITRYGEVGQRPILAATSWGLRNLRRWMRQNKKRLASPCSFFRRSGGAGRRNRNHTSARSQDQVRSYRGSARTAWQQDGAYDSSRQGRTRAMSARKKRRRNPRHAYHRVAWVRLAEDIGCDRTERSIARPRHCEISGGW